MEANLLEKLEQLEQPADKTSAAIPLFPDVEEVTQDKAQEILEDKEEDKEISEINPKIFSLIASTLEGIDAEGVTEEAINQYAKDGHEGYIRFVKELLEQNEDQPTSQYTSPLAQRLDSWVVNGGTEEDFLNRLVEEPEFLSMSDEDVMKFHLVKIYPNLTEEEIKEEVDALRDSGELPKRASGVRKILDNAYTLQLEQEEKELQFNREKEIQESQQHVIKWWTHINTLSEVEGIKLKPKEQEKMYRYAFDPVDDYGRTQMQIDSDKEEVFTLQTLLGSRGWKLSDLIKSVESVSKNKTLKEAIDDLDTSEFNQYNTKYLNLNDEDKNQENLRKALQRKTR